MKGPYSNDFKKIVERMLDRDPTNRPSAEELWTEILPSVSCSPITGCEGIRFNDVMFYRKLFAHSFVSAGLLHSFTTLSVKF